MFGSKQFPEVGDRLAGRFRIAFGRGQGPCGVVFKALDLALDLPVALKVFHQELFSGEFREQNLQRLYRARAYQSPDLVKIYEVMEDRDRFFITSQLMEGMSLSAILDMHAESGEHFTIQKVRVIALRILGGVEFIHKVGAIHGNLKPSNIYIQPDRLALSDPYYLVARKLQEGEEIPVHDYYRGPEQLTDPSLELKETDIYALALILGELVSGNPVKPGIALSEQVPRLTPRFDKIFSRATATDPFDRFHTVQEFSEALVPALDQVAQEGLWLRRYHETGSFRAIRIPRPKVEASPVTPKEPLKPAGAPASLSTDTAEQGASREVSAREEEQAALVMQGEVGERPVEVEQRAAEPSGAQSLEGQPGTVEAEEFEAEMRGERGAVEAERVETADTIQVEKQGVEVVEEVGEEELEVTVEEGPSGQKEAIEGHPVVEDQPVEEVEVVAEAPQEAESTSVEAQAPTDDELVVMAEAESTVETTEDIVVSPEDMPPLPEEVMGPEQPGELEEEADKTRPRVKLVRESASAPVEGIAETEASERPSEAAGDTLEMESVAQEQSVGKREEAAEPKVAPARSFKRAETTAAPARPLKTFAILGGVFVVVAIATFALYSVFSSGGGRKEETRREPAVHTVKRKAEPRPPRPRARKQPAEPKVRVGRASTSKETGKETNTTGPQGPRVAQTGPVAQPQTPPPKPKPEPTRLYQILKCPADMALVVLDREAGRDADPRKVGFCMDRYEFPGKGKTPRTRATFATARSLCRKSGKRLCSAFEWTTACGKEFPYGEEYQSGVCNVASSALAKTGSHPKCRNEFGIYDLVGNAAEWAADKRLHGGDAMRGSKATCGYSTKRFIPGPLDGFRCCKDASL